MHVAIGRLLKEAVHSEHERRSQKRYSFVRPVTVHQPNGTVQLAFSRDLSESGIGLIQAETVDAGRIAEIEIQVPDEPVCLKAEARWCRDYGSGWYLVGWRFISLTRLQIASQRVS